MNDLATVLAVIAIYGGGLSSGLVLARWLVNLAEHHDRR